MFILIEMKKIAIYIDFDKIEDWSFVNGLKNGRNFDSRIFEAKTNHLHGNRVKSLLRYFLYFLYPLKWIICKYKCDYRIAWQQFFGINMAFFMRLFRLKKDAKMMIMTFIYNPRKGFLGHLYFNYIKYSISSEYVDRIVVFSSQEEREYRRIFNLDKFVFIPLGIDIPDIVKNNNTTQSYIFGTGRSNRDWNFLVNALDGSEYKVKIASDIISTIPASDNIEILRNCFGNDMLSMMANSFCVAVPLKETDASAGQLVILQAMALGKPVIATKGGATEDYVIDGVTGYLIDNTPDQLLKCIKLLMHKDVYLRMSENAVARYNQKHTQYLLGDRCGQLTESILCC